MNIIYTKIYEFVLVLEDIRSYNHNAVERRIYDMLHAILGDTQFTMTDSSMQNTLKLTVIMDNAINGSQLEAICVLATGIAYQYDLNNEKDER